MFYGKNAKSIIVPFINFVTNKEKVKEAGYKFYLYLPSTFEYRFGLNASNYIAVSQDFNNHVLKPKDDNQSIIKQRYSLHCQNCSIVGTDMLELVVKDLDIVSHHIDESNVRLNLYRGYIPTLYEELNNDISYSISNIKDKWQNVLSYYNIATRLGKFSTDYIETYEDYSFSPKLGIYDIRFVVKNFDIKNLYRFSEYLFRIMKGKQTKDVGADNCK